MSLAEAQLKEFNRELRAAAKEALATGRRIDLAALSERYERAKVAVSNIKDEIRNVRAAKGTVVTATTGMPRLPI